MDTVDVDGQQPPVIDAPTVPVDDEVDSDAPRVPHQPGSERPAEPDADALTERDRRMLEFERKWWRHAGAKEQAIRDGFDISATRYYQLLNALLDKPAALAHDPVLVQRLRRLRATRVRARTSGRTP